MANGIIKNHNYIRENLGLVKGTIREYDMKEAGFSLIKEFQLLSKKTIKYLQDNYSKDARTIVIGKMEQNDKQLAEDMMEKFITVRSWFYDDNELEPNDIISIKKDALFIYRKQCNALDFSDNIHFALKNRYSSYLCLNKIEFYYSSWKNICDIKGATDENHPLLKDIVDIIRLSEKSNSDQLFKKLKDLRFNYLNKNLPKDYYKEISSRDGFKLKDGYSRYQVYLDTAEDIDLSTIDISYNYVNFIVPLITSII